MVGLLRTHLHNDAAHAYLRNRDVIREEDFRIRSGIRRFSSNDRDRVKGWPYHVTSVIDHAFDHRIHQYCRFTRNSHPIFRIASMRFRFTAVGFSSWFTSWFIAACVLLDRTQRTSYHIDQNHVHQRTLMSTETVFWPASTGRPIV